MADPFAALLAGAKLDPAERYAVDQLQAAGLAPAVVERTATPAPAPAVVEQTGQPEQAALSVDPVEPLAAGELLDYVHGLLTDYERSRPRSMQTALGPSELGHPCRRNIALKLAGVEQARDGLPWAPLQGVWVHAGMEDVLDFDNRGRPGIEGWAPQPQDVWVIEGEVEVDDEIRGHSDALLVRRGTVVDWKYAGKTAVSKLRGARRRGEPPAKQVGQEYRVQGHLYGYARRRKGDNVQAVAIVFLARSHDFADSDVWTEEYREDVAKWAIDRYYEIRAQVDTITPEEIRRGKWQLIQASPGPDACKWCPFAGGNPCPGDVQAVDASRAKFGAGLI